MIAMEKQTLPAMFQAQLAMREHRLIQSCGELERFGLRLSLPEIKALVCAEQETLVACGRLEFGEGILPRLIHTFCDSPYILRDDAFDTLNALQELFYTYKNDLDDTISDDELLEVMCKLFHNKAQGSLLYMENVAVSALVRALCGDSPEDDEDEDGN
jgi:hypothetical protein